ncbi:MAG: hypothetical protein GY896_22470 [Gammaproteobacteria bacterium]|nr:hypothetical protein [Gammaproteobacteria bacterium]
MTGISPYVPLERGTLLPTCLVVLACFCFGTIPYFAKSLSDSGMASYAVTGSVELPTMFFIGWYALGEVIGVAQWLACLLITLAILTTPARDPQPVDPNGAAEQDVIKKPAFAGSF